MKTCKEVALIKEYPAIAEDYTKTSNVKASIKIVVKD